MASYVREAPRERHHPPGGGGPRFVISIDYGTTYTGAAWAVVTDRHPKLRDIKVVMEWPDGNDPKVPSLYTYNERAHKAWGFGINNDPNVIRKTKMRLQKQKREEMMDVLSGFLAEVQALELRDEVDPPLHLLKSPPDTMLDYLIQVAKRIRKDIEGKIKDRDVLRRAAIDLIITHPGKWDSRARNATFRAATEAFMTAMPDYPKRVWTYRMATEPEACAQYTMQVATEGLDNLRRNECFVVVDAGGGTVDLLSYAIRSIEPNFKVEKATDVSSKSCGATEVDTYFLKQFLPQKLGHDEHEKLLLIGIDEAGPGGGVHSLLRPGEQLMLEAFQIHKHNFAGGDDEGGALPDVIDLPEGVGEEDDRERNIRGGQLLITNDEMKWIFKESVDATLELIRQQIAQIQNKGLRVQTIFVSGGFSRSEYLFSEIEKLAARKGCVAVRAEGEDGQGSWTAVAQGAVIMGLQLGCQEPPACTRCPAHIGVVLSEPFKAHAHDRQQHYVDSYDGANKSGGNIRWLIAKGDLIAPSEPIVRTLDLGIKMTQMGHKPGCVRLVVLRSDASGGPPQRLSDCDVPPKELNYDFDFIPAADARKVWTHIRPQQGRAYFQLAMQLRISVSQGELGLAVFCQKAAGGAGSSRYGHYELGSRVEEWD